MTKITITIEDDDEPRLIRIIKAIGMVESGVELSLPQFNLNNKKDIVFGGLTYSHEYNTFYYNGKDILFPKNTKILLIWMFKNPNRPFTRDQMLDHIYGVGTAVEERLIDHIVKKLRKILNEIGAEKVSNMITTIYGEGYKLKTI